MIAIDSIQSQKATARPNKIFSLFFILLALMALVLMTAGIYLSIPFIEVGLENWSSYLSLDWAHQKMLIPVLVKFSLMLWMSVSALFFGGWLLRRSVRRLSGKSWSLLVVNSQRKNFFPPIMLYLKLSCWFLVLIFVYIAFQYPMQFIWSL